MSNYTLIYNRPENITGAPSFFLEYPATLTGNAWGYLLVFIMFSVTFMALQNYNSRKAFAAASFASMTVTVMLTPFGIVGAYLFTITVLMTVLAVLINRGKTA